jgi:hypothetical protein
VCDVLHLISISLVSCLVTYKELASGNKTSFTLLIGIILKIVPPYASTLLCYSCFLWFRYSRLCYSLNRLKSLTYIYLDNS